MDVINHSIIIYHLGGLHAGDIIILVEVSLTNW